MKQKTKQRSQSEALKEEQNGLSGSEACQIASVGLCFQIRRMIDL